MGRNRRAASQTHSRRATAGPRADRHAAELTTRLGKMLKDARSVTGLTQSQASAIAGITQSTWSRLENDGDPRFTLATWDRAAFAVGTRLDAYLPQATATDQPRDAVHLRTQ